MEGIILKGIGGFYYVESANGIYECKARGLFRKQGITPLAGDKVEFTPIDDQKGSIDKIFPRKNFLTRPAVSNLDRLFIVVSVSDPAPNYFIIDKTIAAAENKEIEPVIVITKTDIENPDEIYNIYKSVGFPVVLFSAVSGIGSEEILKLLENKVSAFTGNSGVGKSSLLNRIFPSLDLATGETSKKLGRGRHTTRQVELYNLANGYVADTPGFSAFEFERFEIIEKENLQYCFREFSDYIGNCKFISDCSHTCEKGCAVIEAVENGKINLSRHKSYIQMYDEVKNISKWQLK